MQGTWLVNKTNVLKKLKNKREKTVKNTQRKNKQDYLYSNQTSYFKISHIHYDISKYFQQVSDEYFFLYSFFITYSRLCIRLTSITRVMHAWNPFQPPHFWKIGWYSPNGSSSSWAKNQLKFTTVYTKLEPIFVSTWAWSLLWIPTLYFL